MSFHLKFLILVLVLICALTLATPHDFGIVPLWSVVIVWSAVLVFSSIPLCMYLLEKYKKYRAANQTENSEAKDESFLTVTTE